MDGMLALALNDFVESSRIIDESKTETAFIVENEVLLSIKEILYANILPQPLLSTYLELADFHDLFKVVVKNYALSLVIMSSDFYEEIQDAISIFKHNRVGG